MKYYSPESTKNALNETYAFIRVSESNHTMTLTLDRAEKKNALHPHMINEMAFALQYAKFNKDIWTVIVAAEGNVFCAGADLKAFMGILGEFESSVPNPDEEILLGELFKKVHKPIIVKVTGDVYAGGFFFLASGTYVIAQDGVKFGLPEVKRGLYPFQVMAALMEVMPRRKVIDWCIRGYKLEANKALDYGLVTHVVASDQVDQTAHHLLTELHENSPSAIRLGLESLEVMEASDSKHKYLMEMLQKTVASKDGQEGLTAFREKRKPVWTGE